MRLAKILGQSRDKHELRCALIILVLGVLTSGANALAQDICPPAEHKPTTVREFGLCKETVTGKPYRLFFDSNWAYSDEVLSFLAEKFDRNSNVIIGANPQDKENYKRSREKARELKLLWSSNRIGPGMPREFPSDRKDILEYTRTMESMKGKTQAQRIAAWTRGAWIDKHREWITEDSRDGVFCSEWDNIHLLKNPIKVFIDHQKWELEENRKTKDSVTTRIMLKNIYPETATKLARAFDLHKKGKGPSEGALDPTRFCPIAMSEDDLSAKGKRTVRKLLAPYGIVPSDTLDSCDYRTKPKKQPCGHVGPDSTVNQNLSKPVVQTHHHDDYNGAR